MLKKISPTRYIKYLSAIYLLGVILFSLFRASAFIINQSSLNSVPNEEQFSMIANAMLVGWRFDTVISMYLLALPLLLLFVDQLVFKNKSALNISVKWFINVLYSIAFFICTADLPFFHHFNYRLNSAALMWAESMDTAIGMIAQDIAYWGVLLPFVGILVLFVKLNSKLFKTFFTDPKVRIWHKDVVWFLLSGAICFLALRGTTNFSLHPLNEKDAYFSDYSIINQTSLNPVFTFLKSVTNKGKKGNNELTLMDTETALFNVRSQLKRNYIDSTSISEIVTPDSIHINQPNVVLVLMEGLSAHKLATFGDTTGSTPFIDSLIQQSYFFKNAYSAGIHTHNGIFSSLTSLPALFSRHALTQIPILRYNNLISALKANNYSSIYFSNHDVEFDNVGGFLVENGIDKLISDKHYEQSKKLSVWGVADDYMFETALPYINDIAEKENPFLSIFMTTSNHRPFRFPDNYNRRFTDDENEGPAFADWSLKQFMNDAKKQTWFDNTIFVFMSDHGWPMNVRYDIPLSYVHVPFFFYSPKYFPNPTVDKKLAGQIDLFPTLMSALKLPYSKTGMGIDLFTESRPYIYFNADNKIGVIDSNYYYIYRKNGPESLYELPSLENSIEQHRALSDSMKNYVFSQMQLTYDMIESNNVGSLNN